MLKIHANIVPYNPIANPGFLRGMVISIAILLSGAFLYPIKASAQTQKSETKVPGGILVTAIIVDGDTMLFSVLPTYYFYSPKVFRNKKEQAEYTRLVRNVMRVYPYARLAGIKLKEYNDLMLVSPTDKSRKALMKQAEEELEAQFGKELRKLTFTQGIILLKLIDRETGQTGYDLVAELRGSFRAFFWQGIGRLFGYNLRVKYEPKGKDSDIEEIVMKIIYGQL